MAAPAATLGKAELVQVAVRPCRLCHAIRAGKLHAFRALADMATSKRPQHAGLEAMAIPVSAYRLAARRVTAYFLSQFPNHTTCLSTPRIAWNLLDGHAQQADVLARCCPMAIGFWAWCKATQGMHSVLKHAAHRVPERNPDMLVPLLYVSMRSLLHYCIATASEAMHALPVSNDDRRALLRRMRDLEREALWSALRDPWAFGRDGNYATVVRFDASTLLRQIDCTDHADFDKLLNSILGERFSAVSPLSAAKHWFVPGRGQWVLVPRSWSHLIPVRERGYTVYLADAFDWLLVLKAIDRRQQFA